MSFRPREGYELHPINVVLCPVHRPEGGYRPREGYELHLKTKNIILRSLSYRPREGYELHRDYHGKPDTQGKRVIVPVRGMSCIRSVRRLAENHEGYRPREGYELHPWWTGRRW